MVKSDYCLMYPSFIDDPDSLRRKRQKFNNSPNSLVLRHVQAEAEKREYFSQNSLQLYSLPGVGSKHHLHHHRTQNLSNCCDYVCVLWKLGWYLYPTHSIHFCHLCIYSINFAEITNYVDTHVLSCAYKGTHITTQPHTRHTTHTHKQHMNMNIC